MFTRSEEAAQGSADNLAAAFRTDAPDGLLAVFQGH